MGTLINGLFMLVLLALFVVTVPGFVYHIWVQARRRWW